ncbi:ricin-type beta-trefoil lectin domain protein [Streptomyces sp. NPDC057900]|uniref:ricin-type beta-trefoil lectin domain protein n=1 Tax=Streptomyces sp. NPDC057900 TaxID=3346274 RepID=UPI0036E46109
MPVLAVVAVLVLLALGWSPGTSGGVNTSLLEGPRLFGAETGPRVCGRTMVGVAHQDDDLLFVNPVIQREIGPKCAFSTVYLTAGDAGHPYNRGDVVQDREKGVRAAYAEMAGVPDRWTRHDVQAAGHRIASFTLNGEFDVRLSFLRLPDGQPVGIGYPRYGHQSLLKLFRGEIASIRPVDGSPGYTEPHLVAVLTALARQERISRILTLDYDNVDFGHTYWPGADHSDHGVTARYLRRVAFGLPGITRVTATGFLGYDMSRLPEDLGPLLSRQKDAFFQSYRVGEGCMSKSCPAGHYMNGKYLQWTYREYSVKPRVVRPGEIVSAMGLANATGRYQRCLGSAGGGRGADRAREAATFNCTGRADQSWRVHAGTIESGAGRQCLTAASQRVTVSTCDGRPHQRWRRDTAGRIRSAASRTGGRCLFQQDLALRDPRLLLRPCSPARPELSWSGAGALPVA